jgi:hypothetical protein
MKYQIIKLESAAACKEYMQDVIDGQEGYIISRTKFSFILSYNGAIVLILKWQ